MPASKTPTKRSTTASAAASANRRSEKAVAAIDVSLEKTQAALTSMRSDLGRDSKRIARDIEKLVSTARRDVRKLSKAIRSDVTHVGRPAARPRPAAKPSTRSRARA